MTLVLLLLALSLAGDGARTDPAEALEELERWIDRIERGSSSFDREELADLGRALEDAARPPEDELARWHAAYLDLTALERTAGRAPVRFVDEVRRRARDVLHEELSYQSSSRELIEWIAREVLVASLHPLPRRLAALELLQGRYLPRTKLALFHLVEGSHPELAAAALDAVVGWPEEDVHDFVLDLWERRRDAGEGAALLEVLQAHFGVVPAPVNESTAERLTAVLSPLIVSPEWRTATRAVDLTSPLPSVDAVPLLIESLRVWQSRVARGAGSLRIESEIAGELERRSNVRLGRNADRWTTWWRNARRGLATGALLPEDRPRTKARFFGLRLESDRIAFVIDNSVSMGGVHYRTQRTRYEEATLQLLDYLREAGPRTRFSLTLFHDRGVRWRPGLYPATERHIEMAESWLQRRDLGPGTRLQAGLEEATHMSLEEDVELGRLEADTVVIFCDGETPEDAAWARRWLDHTNGTAQLVYHVVQVGNDDEGALESLAHETDGNFMRLSD